MSKKTSRGSRYSTGCRNRIIIGSSIAVVSIIIVLIVLTVPYDGNTNGDDLQTSIIDLVPENGDLDSKWEHYQANVVTTIQEEKVIAFESFAYWNTIDYRHSFSPVSTIGINFSFWIESGSFSNEKIEIRFYSNNMIVGSYNLASIGVLIYVPYSWEFYLQDGNMEVLSYRNGNNIINDSISIDGTVDQVGFYIHRVYGFIKIQEPKIEL
jgi:hypothetical protein